MRIITKSQLLELPLGAIFYRVDPNCFDELLIFRGRCGDEDFFYSNISIPKFERTRSDQDTARVWNEMQHSGMSTTIDLDTSERDGLFEEDALFMVLEEKDIKILIETLMYALGKVCPNLKL